MNSRKRLEYIDPWSFLDFKPAYQNQGTQAAYGTTAPQWAGETEWRRLSAYRLLESYYRNAGAAWMDPEVDQEDVDNHREYGDPQLIVNSVVSSILGDKQTLVVEGLTEEDDEEGPLHAQLDQFDQWARDERFLMKMMECERNSVKLGDGVYVLGWDVDKERPRLRVYDPGFYFPVLDDWSHDDDYPRKVHIAWEYERPNAEGKKEKFLRRITWELIRTDSPIDYSWNPKPVPYTCIMYELEWRMTDVKGEVQDLAVQSATVIRELTDLNIDFIPVVHVPNTVSECDHYGVSNLAPVLQLFDDLSSADTDLAAASATTGSPVIGVGGVQMGTEEDGRVLTYGPGSVLETGDGRLDMLDTSRSLDALLKYSEAMLDRLSVNARTPNTLLGRVDPSKVPSGIVLTLSFQPHSNMVRELRLVRENKYDLLLKFIGRMFMANGLLDNYTVMHVKFGSFLPADRQETATIVQQGLATHAMSIEMAVQMYIEAGFPIDDAMQEVTRIVEQNYTAANEALQATNDIDFVRELLGLEPLANQLGLPGLTDENGNPLGPDGQPIELPAPQQNGQVAPLPGGGVLP